MANVAICHKLRIEVLNRALKIACCRRFVKSYENGIEFDIEVTNDNKNLRHHDFFVQ